MDSMLVSGKEALQANSDRHLTASWKESMVAGKCFSNTFAGRKKVGNSININYIGWDAPGGSPFHMNTLPLTNVTSH